MFEIGDLVTYAASGVCKISGTMENKVKGKKVKYLVLTPVYESSSKIYVPMDNEELLSRIGSIMSKEDIDSLIRSMPDIDAQWIGNDIERAQSFRSIIKSGDRKEIMKMVRMLYLHRKDQLEHGRKFHASDEHFLKEAEHILFDEFAVVLGIEPEQVVDHITKTLDSMGADMS